MKKLHSVALISYAVIVLYFAIFNWSVFVVNLEIHWGFATVRMPAVAFITVLGLIFLLVQWVAAQMSLITHERDLARKENEIMALQISGTGSNASSEIQKIADHVAALEAKITALAPPPAAPPPVEPGGEKRIGTTAVSNDLT